MQLKLNTRKVDDVTIVDCNGRIVFGEESALLRDSLKQLIKANSRIVLNLGGVSYIDSGGLGTLVALYTTAQNAGGAVKLSNLTQRVDDCYRSPSCSRCLRCMTARKKRSNHLARARLLSCRLVNAVGLERASAALQVEEHCL